LYPFLGPGEASDKVGRAAMAVMSEKKCILAVSVLTSVELVRRRHSDG
jgi:hypothetical protein